MHPSGGGALKSRRGPHISVILGPGGPIFTVRLGPGSPIQGGPRFFMTPHSLQAASDRAKVPLLIYRPQLGLSLCWRFPRRVTQRTASLLVTSLFVFHSVALLLGSRFIHTAYTCVYTIIKIGAGLFEMDCEWNFKSQTLKKNFQNQIMRTNFFLAHG